MSQNLWVAIGYGVGLPDFGDYQDKVFDKFLDSYKGCKAEIAWGEDEFENGLILIPSIYPVQEPPTKTYTADEADKYLMDYLKFAVDSLNLTDQEKQDAKLRDADLKALIDEADFVMTGGYC